MDGANRAELEKMARYLLKPPFSLERLGQRGDGAITYRLARPDGKSRTVLVLSPLELLGRLSALIPAPRQALRRCFGVLASGAKERGKVVPRPTTARCHHPSSQPVTTTEKPLPTRIPWSDLMKRIWGLECLRCGCGALMTPVAVIRADEERRRYLDHTGDGADPDCRARAPPDVAA